MRFCSLIVLCILLISCGADEEETVSDIPDIPFTKTHSTLGEMKHQITNDPTAAAPQMPNNSRPRLTEVGFYKDWRLTKPLMGKVNPKRTIYTKIVFSENMQHVASDAGNARPIISYVIDGKAKRYKMKPHTDKIQSGDCKPLGRGPNTNQFICRYTVQTDDVGTFSLKIGKFSRSANGKPLAATYRHKEHLQLGTLMQPATVIEISYYRDAGFTEPLIDSIEIETTIYTKVVFSKDVPIVPADTPQAQPSISFTVEPKESRYRIKPRSVKNKDLRSGEGKPYKNTKNAFVCKYVVQIEDFGREFFTHVEDQAVTGDPLRIITSARLFDKFDKHGITGQQNLRDFAGLVCTPRPELKISNDRIVTQPRQEPWPVSGAIVTIQSGPRFGEVVSTDQDGRYIFPNFRGDEMRLLVEKDQFEAKEVIVYRSRPTILANGDIPNYHNDPQKIPGTILIGRAWPEKVRPVLQQTTTVHDLLYLEASLPEDYGGFYDSGIVVININSRIGNKGRIIAKRHGINDLASTVAHEIAHAYQHALVAIDGRDIGDWTSAWENTPEARSFAAARRKDWEEFGKADYDHNPAYSSLLENMAETFSYWWSIGRWEKNYYERLEIDAPHRFKWAEKWLTK